MSTTIDLVHFFRNVDQWCYRAWDHLKFNHEGTLAADPDDETDARNELAEDFPGAQVIRIADLQPKLQIEANESAELLALSLDDCPNEEPYRSECVRAWWDAFNAAAGSDDRLSRVEFVRPRGNRLMLSQWNGARFAWQRAVFGSSSVPTQAQQDAIDQASSAADLAAAEVWSEIQAELAAADDEVDE